MRRKASALLLPLTVIAMSTAAAPNCKELLTTVEVAGDQGVRKEVGSGLTFRIERDDDSAGWTFEVGTGAAASDQIDSYIYLVTPPWRGRHVTMLNTAYATPPQDVVAPGARRFWFLLEAKNAAAASEALNAILWRYPDLTEEKALSILRRMAKGSGALRVLTSEIAPTTHLNAPTGNTAAPVELKRLTVQVALLVPSTFNAAPGWAVKSAKCPDPRVWPSEPQ